MASRGKSAHWRRIVRLSKKMLIVFFEELDVGRRESRRCTTISSVMIAAIVVAYTCPRVSTD